MSWSFWSSTLFLVIVALLLGACWAIGAYRRLKELRSSMRKSLGYVLDHWSQEMDMLKGFFPDSVTKEQLDVAVTQESAAWRALYAAIGQVNSTTRSLLISKPSKPVKREHLEALHAARTVLLESWQRLENSTADLAGSRIPQDMLHAWKRTETLTTDRLSLYNHRVGLYNNAIEQWPASILRKPYGFQRAVPLI